MDEQSIRKSTRLGYMNVAALIITSFVPLSLALSCAGIFYPYIAEDWGVGAGMMSYYTSFIWLSSTIFLSFLGQALQRFNARIVLSAAVALMAVTFVWLSFASSLWQFYAGAFVMGLGISMLLFLAPSTLINRWFAKRAGFLLGIVMAFTGVGGVVWSAVGGSLILNIGWAMTYRVFAAMCAVAVLTTLLLVSNSPADKGLLPVGAQGHAQVDIASSDDAQGIPVERAFKMPIFFLIVTLVFFLNFGMYVYFMIPSYLKTLEISASMPLLGATASSVAMAGQTVAKLVYGAAGDKFPHACMAIGLGLGIGGIVLLAMGLQVALIIYVAAFIFGAYYGLTNVMAPLITRRNFGDRDYPKIYSRVSMGATVGNVLAAFALGALIDASGSYMGLFLIVAVLLALSIALTLVIKKKSEPVA